MIRYFYFYFVLGPFFFNYRFTQRIWTFQIPLGKGVETRCFYSVVDLSQIKSFGLFLSRSTLCSFFLSPLFFDSIEMHTNFPANCFYDWSWKLKIFLLVVEQCWYKFSQKLSKIKLKEQLMNGSHPLATNEQLNRAY